MNLYYLIVALIGITVMALGVIGHVTLWTSIKLAILVVIFMWGIKIYRDKVRNSRDQDFDC